MAPFQLGIIGDAGNYRTNGTRFYYSPGGAWSGNKNINSIGPGQAAVADLIQGFGASDLVSLGDMTYTTGASTLIDEANGLDYNNYMAPYPSPQYLEKPYLQTDSNKVWPYDTYDFPKGFPNPLTGGPGGSSDGINRFWPVMGNHDYGLRISYSETNISEGSNNTTQPVGKTSTAVPQPTLDYFGWLSDPSLLTRQKNVKIAKADGSGQSGVYYSVELGKQKNGRPLIELFGLDAQRLTMNAGGYYQLSDGYGTNNTQSASYNYAYDPTKPYKPGSNTAAVLTSDPDNGQAQFRWLKQGLKQSEARWKILAGHQPIYSSGQWGKSQPDDHMSNPVMQRILKALPKDSFHAYINGHSHYYQRVLEGNGDGIGQGIPFITNGNSGRILYAINQTQYGDNVYSPSTPGLSQETYNGVGSKGGDISPYLLPSDPITVGVAGGYFTTDNGLYTGKKNGFTSGAYGYGFGGQEAQAAKSFLLMHYKQTDVLDPSITENLSADTRNLALSGWDGLTSSDWKPALSSGMSSSEVLDQTAQFSITIDTSGAISAVSVTKSGAGYMASHQGNHTVDFEIRGNDSYTDNQLVNPNNYAIATLSFRDGRLVDATLKSSGDGYQYLAQANGAIGYGTTNPLTSPQTNIIPINTSLLESWYTVPYTDYQDWYLITDTTAKVRLKGKPGGEGSLIVEVTPLSNKAKDIINDYPTTTGYSGEGAQRAYPRAMSGTVKLFADGERLGKTKIIDGYAVLPTKKLPSNKEEIRVEFMGDPITSYQVNYLPSTSKVKAKKAQPSQAQLSEANAEISNMLYDSTYDYIGMSMIAIDSQHPPDVFSPDPLTSSLAGAHNLQSI
jgi:hypothetical protein